MWLQVSTGWFIKLYNTALFLLCQKNTKAPQAAGKIHTDFEKGFIMAEVQIWAVNVDSFGEWTIHRVVPPSIWILYMCITSFFEGHAASVGVLCYQTYSTDTSVSHHKLKPSLSCLLLFLCHAYTALHYVVLDCENCFILYRWWSLMISRSTSQSLQSR